MRVLALALALALALVALGGCLGDAPSTMQLTPYLGVVRAEPGRATTLALFVNNTGGFREGLAVEVVAPANWTAAPPAGEPSFVDGKSTTTLLVDLTLPADARYGAHRVFVRAGGGEVAVVVDVRDLAGEPVAAGGGAALRVARALESGQVVATNMKEIRDLDAAPRLAPAVNATAEDMRPLVMCPVEAPWDAIAVGMKAGETRAARVAGEVRIVEVADADPAACGA